MRSLVERPALMLTLTTAFFGLSFSLVKPIQDAARDNGSALVGGLVLVGVRCLAALPLLALVQFRLFTLPSWREHRQAALVGLAFTAGIVLQAVGLAYTTPGRSGFFTMLCSAWVPVLAWVWLGQRPAILTALGLILGLGGAVVLAGERLDGHREGFGTGEVLTLIASGFFAVQVLLLDQFGKQTRSDHFTVGLLTVTGTLSLTTAGFVSWCFGPTDGWATLTILLDDWKMLARLTVLVVICTGLAFHWMNVYQPRLTASRAALIYLLEPVFAATLSIAVGLEYLTSGLVVGGGLILVGNLIAEIPTFCRGRLPIANATVES